MHIKLHELYAMLDSMQTEDGPKIEELRLLSDLLEQTDYDSIEKVLFELYPDEMQFKEQYRGFYTELAAAEPAPGKAVLLYLDEQTIVSEQTEESEEPDIVESGYLYSEIKGIDPENSYELNLEFFGWNEWLTFHILEKDAEDAGTAGYLAHCFYKMTINGYNREDIEMNLEQKKKNDDPVKETTSFLSFLSGPNVEIEDRPATGPENTFSVRMSIQERWASDGNPVQILSRAPEPENDVESGQIRAKKGLWGKLLDFLKGK